MNNTVSHLEGIDLQIQQHQTLVYNRLIFLWGANGLTANNFQMYGRTYRNYRNGGYVPEWFVQGTDYTQDLFFDDKLAALMWYGLRDPETVASEAHTYNVSIFGFVRLDMLKPNNPTQRMDMAVLNDVHKIADNKFGFRVTEAFRDIDNVLQRYSGMLKNQALNQDMQPFFAFRIDMENMLWLNDCNSARFAYPMQMPMVTSYYVVFKDDPDTTKRQQLTNGAFAQVEFATGNTVTIPYLSGRTWLDIQQLNWSNITIPYSGNTFDNSANSGFVDGDTFVITVNVT